VHKSIKVDWALITYDDQLLTDLEWSIVKTAKQHHAHTFYRLRREIFYERTRNWTFSTVSLGVTMSVPAAIFGVTLPNNERRRVPALVYPLACTLHQAI
jgi:hypothetical protein